MSASTAVFFVLLLLLAYGAGPVALVWGCVRWTNLPKMWTFASVLSFVGFLSATASAILAVSSVAYAHVHHFEFYDPLLKQIFRWGFLLSLSGIAFAMGGIWRKNVLRWFAVASAACTFTFWVLAAEAE
jgi:hypothetical protein